VYEIFWGSFKGAEVQKSLKSFEQTVFSRTEWRLPYQHSG